MKKLIFLIIVTLIANTNCKKSAPELKCKGEIISELVVSYSTYGVNLTITNTGDKEIKYVSVPFKVYFKNGTSEERSAYFPAVSLLPGQSNK